MSAARQPADRTFRTSELVPCSGLYRSNHAEEGCDALQMVFIAGELFPNCSQCGGEALFALLRSAPYIHEDPDFPKP